MINFGYAHFLTIRLFITGSFSEQHTHALLRRLSPKGSPTFFDYGNHPPARVLDLGCGQGDWVVDAARTWNSHDTRVTGLDLVNVVGNWDLEPSVANNISWVRHNLYVLAFLIGLDLLLSDATASTTSFPFLIGHSTLYALRISTSQFRAIAGHSS